MNMVQEISEKEDKKEKRKQWIIAIALHLLIIIPILFIKFDSNAKPEDELIPLFEFDYQEAGADKGGSSSEAESKTKEQNESSVNEEKVITQKNSETTANDKKKQTSKNKGSTQKVNQNSLFSGGGTGGSGEGNGQGDLEGDGPGEGSGPNLSGKVGNGSGRSVKYKPTISNPINDEGKVVVQVTINREGEVKSAVVVPSLSSSTLPEHQRAAIKAAKKYKFSSNPNGKYDLEKKNITVHFVTN